MAKIKKSFDKELMYKKIMPTSIRKNGEHNNEAAVKNSNNEDAAYDEKTISINANTIYINEKPITAKMDDNDEADGKIINEKEAKNDDGDYKLCNIMETLVLERLDITLNKMNCCKCDRCREDIIALALNNLKPMYIVATKEEIDNKIKEFDKLGLEVTTAVLKAVLSIRKSPRH